MVAKVAQVVDTPELSAALQTQEAQEHKARVVPVVFRQVTAFPALPVVNILVEIHEMNLVAAAAVTSVAAAVEITAAAVVAQATSIHEQLPARRHRQER
jgi:hypothetical protein